MTLEERWSNDPPRFSHCELFPLVLLLVLLLQEALCTNIHEEFKA